MPPDFASCARTASRQAEQPYWSPFIPSMHPCLIPWQGAAKTCVYVTMAPVLVVQGYVDTMR